MASSTLFFFLCAAIMLLSLTTTTAQPIYKSHYCSNAYFNSGFAVNVNRTVSSLIADAATSSNGFYNLSIGQSPADRVYGLFQCRGDISPGLCHTCIQASSENISSLCPYNKEVIIWYDMCTLRYANRSIFGIMEFRPNFCTSSGVKTPGDDDFNATLSSLMEGLITKAVSGGSEMFATGDKALSIGPTLYGLVQCTSDISQTDCKECLSHTVAVIMEILVFSTKSSQIGRSFFAPSCNARYERYRFYGDPVAAAGAATAPPDFIPRSEDEKKRIVPIVVGVVGFSLVFLAFVFLWWRRYMSRGEARNSSEGLRGLDLQTGFFTLKQIKAATNNFDSANKIGEGGFGPVYKGLLSDGTIIAVKQLSSKSSQGNREFLNEMGVITCLRHPNLVKIYGCCIEGDQLLLVYEYLENNCLAHALFGLENLQLKLDWSTRHKICVGIAKGLAFLHEESSPKIVHRDIKGTNVLLDRDLNPKISDFGLAKLHEEDKSHISTRIAGTIGYIAPEYASRGYLTDKADVYSFGIVALEIVSGKHNMNFGLENNFDFLLDWACHLQQSRNLLELVDQKLGSEFNNAEAERMIKVSLLCTNASHKLRPTMSEVVNMLEGTINILDVIPEVCK